MRRTLTLCRAGLVGAAAVVLLAACGGNGGSATAASSAPAASTGVSSSPAGRSGPAASTPFCTQAATVMAQLDDVGNVQDPAQLGPALQQAAAALRSLDPPPEIAGDWNTLVGAFSQVARIASTTDFTDPQQLAAFEQQAQQVESRLGTSETTVQDYLSDQCGISDNSGGTTAPSS
jgi:hypothetical protein